MTRIGITAAGAILVAACGDTTGAGAGSTPTSAPKPATAKPASPPSSGGQPTLAGAEPDGKRCRASSVKGKVGPGERTSTGTYSVSIHLSYTGSGSCTLQGASELKILTGGSGGELDIKQVTTDDGSPHPQINLKPDGVAFMIVEYSTAPSDQAPPDCHIGGTFALVTMPGDTETVEAWPEQKDLREAFPPICGAVSTSPWYEPG